VDLRTFLRVAWGLVLCALAPVALAKTVKTSKSVKSSPSKPVQTPPLSDSERDFSRAEELFKSGQEDAAIVSLTDFLRRYPASAQADDAQYLIGEVEYRRRNFDNAVRELKKTLDYRKRGGDRVADAYYLIGDSLLRLGQAEKARIEWEALRRAYPKSPAAGRAALKIMELDQK
jgi:TolA-binding protein